MADPPRYVLDADVFMTAARSYYAFDVAPGFWQGLIQQASSGHVLSIDHVKQEIDRGKDELTQWANQTFHSSFASTAQDDVVEAYRRISGVRRDNCDSAGKKSQEPLTFRTCFRRDSLYYSFRPD